MARYRIDPSRSQVWINARSNVHPIHSRTDGLEGWIDLKFTSAGRLDLRARPTAHLEFAVAHLRSANPLEQRELRRRIDAKHHPLILGELTILEPGADGHFRAGGEVTFRGVTRAHSDELTIEEVDDSTIRVEGRSTFDVRDFGMEPPKILVLKVEPLVEVRIEVTAELGS